MAVSWRPREGAGWGGGRHGEVQREMLICIAQRDGAGGRRGTAGPKAVAASLERRRAALAALAAHRRDSFTLTAINEI